MASVFTSEIQTERKPLKAEKQENPESNLKISQLKLTVVTNPRLHLRVPLLTTERFQKLPQLETCSLVSCQGDKVQNGFQKLLLNVCDDCFPLTCVACEAQNKP